MLPSNMEIEVRVVNGYKNLNQIATDEMQLGFNASVNESRGLPSEITSEETESKTEFDFVDPEPQPTLLMNQQTSEPVDQRSNQMQPNLEATSELVTSEVPLTHDEKKTFFDFSRLLPLCPQM